MRQPAEVAKDLREASAGLIEDVNNATIDLVGLAEALRVMLDFFADQAEAAAKVREMREKRAGIWRPGPNTTVS